MHILKMVLDCAGGAGGVSDDLGRSSDEDIGKALGAGLGPLLWRLMPDLPQRVSAQALDRIRAAWLTAEVITQERYTALADILAALRDRCEGAPVLLKGVSVASEYYPTRSLRTMADTDLLVAASELPLAEATLHELGYRQESSQPADFYRHHHHSMPFRHCETGLWVELHTSLVAPRSPFAQSGPLSLETVHANLRDSVLGGMPVRRLSPELELVYIACHWAREWRRPGSLFALFDILFLLQTRSNTLEWSRFLRLADAPHARPCVQTLMRYLLRRTALQVPVEVQRWLAVRGPADRLISRARTSLIDHYIVDRRPTGRFATDRNLNALWNTLLDAGSAPRQLALIPWNLQFPPQNRERFDASFQLRRLRRVLGRRR